MTRLPQTWTAFLWHFLKQWPWSFALFFIAPMSIVIEANLIPYVLKLVVDGITKNTGSREHIFEVIAPALWLGGLSWLLFVALLRSQHWWQSRVIPEFQAKIRLSVLDDLLQHSQRYFSNQLAGKLANKVADLPRAMDAIRMILCWNVVATLAVVLTSVFVMATVNAVFPLIFMAWIALHVATSLALARRVHRMSAINAENKTTLSGGIVDTLSNITSMRLFARRAYERQWIAKLQAKEIASNRAVILSIVRLNFMMDVAFISMMACITWFLLRGWQQGGLSTGDVIFVFNIVWAVSYQTWFLGNALADLFREMGVAQQALNLMSEPYDVVDVPDAKPLHVTAGAISFENVSFHYNQGQSIFENKNVRIEAGQKVGLVGFSGSGKTTFAHLILRFFDVEAGRILIDGQDIAKVTQDSLHESIAMIPQDTSLFHRSLRENLRYGRLDASEQEIVQACKRAHCHDFIAALPQGYDCLVGERGTKLSGGQRQRIAIARAFLKNAPILILDEATSALDSVTERHIQEGLQELMQGRTTIVIAHRLSTLSQMDRILVFDKGHVVEDGSHEQLLSQSGHYAKMWQMQAGGFLPDAQEHL